MPGVLSTAWGVGEWESPFAVILVVGKSKGCVRRKVKRSGHGESNQAGSSMEEKV